MTKQQRLKTERAFRVQIEEIRKNIGLMDFPKVSKIEPCRTGEQIYGIVNCSMDYTRSGQIAELVRRHKQFVEFVQAHSGTVEMEIVRMGGKDSKLRIQLRVGLGALEEQGGKSA